MAFGGAYGVLGAATTLLADYSGIVRMGCGDAPILLLGAGCVIGAVNGFACSILFANRAHRKSMSSIIRCLLTWGLFAAILCVVVGLFLRSLPHAGSSWFTGLAKVYFVLLFPATGLLAAYIAIVRVPDELPGPLRCVQCDYNLTGNVSGVCPECGRKIERP